MPDQLQLRGGTTAQHASFTGASKEVTVDTTKKTLVVHDGSTAGGNPLLREDQSNLPTTAPTTGIYNASGSLAISTGGSGRLFVDSSGNVGVGTSPASKLHVNAATGSVFTQISSGANDLYLGYDAIAGLQSLQSDTGIYFSTGASFTERLRITSAGLVGVGTSSPSVLLDVYGTGSVLGKFVRNNTGGASGGVTIGNNDRTYTLFGDGSIFSLYDNTAAATRLAVDTSGRVGIGTSAPGQKFVVNGTSGSNAIQIENSDDANRGGRLLATGSAASGVFQINSTSGGYGITFGIDGNEAVRVDTSRRLLVGTSSTLPVYYNSTAAWNSALQVARSSQDAVANFSIWDSTASTYTLYGGAQIHLSACKSGTVGSHTSGALANGDSIASINFNASDGTNFRNAARIEAVVDAASGTADVPGRLVFSTTADGASSPTERMRITQAGHMLQGVNDITFASSQSYGNAFSGNNSYANWTSWGTGTQTHASFRNGTAAVGSIISTSSATSYNTSSDHRLKENIASVTDGITRLQQLKPCRFNFIVDPATTVDGFIAHEVQAVVPEAITGKKDAIDDDGNPIYQGIDQSKLVPLLTAALQEAIGEIESLKARLTAAGI